MSEKCEIGLIGLAVMGQNLVRNMARNGFKVAVYNRTSAKTKAFVESVPEEAYPGYTEEFVGLEERAASC
ncbi:MAG: NAD(P)-binding domain-containing protein [Christensenellales bacterium]